MAWRTAAQKLEDGVKQLRMMRDIWRWQPHEAQRKFFDCPAEIKVAACGRRWGKTQLLAMDAVTLALVRPGCVQLIVAPTDGQARLLGDRIADLVRRLPSPKVGGATTVIRQSPHLTIKIGIPATGVSQILCRTAGRDGRALRGLSADRIIVDEAAQVPDCVLTEVLRPMLLDTGGEYVLASTPLGRVSEFYRLFARGIQTPTPSPSPVRTGDSESRTVEGSQNPTPLSHEVGEGPGVGVLTASPLRYQSFQCPTSDNPTLDKGRLAAEREDMTEEQFAQEMEAQFVNDHGAVFREEDITAAIEANPAVTLEGGHIVSEPQPGREYVAGIDWGRKHDFSVLAVVDTTDAPMRLVHLERWRGDSWERQVQQSAATLAKFRPRRILADGNSIGDPVIETLQNAVQDLGQHLTVERFSFGADSKRNLIDKLTLRLSARSLRYPPHRILLSEMRSYEYGGMGSTGRPKMGARPGGHDDCVTALALASYAAPDPAARLRDFTGAFLFGSQTGLATRTVH